MCSDVNEIEKTSCAFSFVSKAFSGIASIKERVSSAMDNPLIALIVVMAAGAYIPVAMWLATEYQFDYLLYPVLLAVMYFGFAGRLKGKGGVR